MRMNEPITFGSVCSGIEAASVAWAPLGWKAAWLAEIEPFPCAVLAHHYPGVPNLGDMTKIAHLIRDGFVSAPPVFCGGTPCQAFSIAGLRNSLDDARGNLTMTFCEIADEIDTRRAATGLLPSIIVWENVPGVLSTPDNAFGCFLGALAGEDCPLEPPGGKWPNAGCVFGPQRTVAWRVFDAQYFGVAQRRRRVFVVASAREGFDPTEVLFEFDGVRRDTAPSREAGQETAGTLASRTDGGGFPGTDEACSGYVQPVECFGGGRTGGSVDVAACLTARGMRIDFEVETFAVQPVAFQTRGSNVDLGQEVYGTLTQNCDSASGGAPCIAFDSRQDPVSSTEVFGALGSSSPQAQAVAHTLDAAAGRSRGAGTPVGILTPVCVTGEITHTLKAEGFDASEDGTGRGQPLVPVLQYQHHCPCGRSFFGQMDALCPECGGGNSVVESEPHEVLEPIVASVALRGRDGGATAELGDDLAGCLRASGGGGDKPHALVNMAVRRLTPRECERLQSFPDDYTLIPYGRVVKMEKLERDWIKYLLRGGVMTLEQVCQAAADGPRYKALGNSWCVYNARWIGRRIDRHLRALSGAISETIVEKATA